DEGSLRERANGGQRVPLFRQVLATPTRAFRGRRGSGLHTGTASRLISAMIRSRLSMASAELSVIYSDDDQGRFRGTGQPGQPLHRIQEVRRLQGMSLRTAARQLGTDIRSIRAQEQATTDLRLTDIYNWQRAL